MVDPKANLYALAAIRERRAEMSGEIVKLEGWLRYLRDALSHIDATLRILDPERDPSTIRDKRPYKRVKLFGAGKLNRMILAALARGGRPMTTSEVVDAVVAEMKFGPEAAKVMKNRVRANLTYLTRERGTVAKDGERATAVWRLAR